METVMEPNVVYVILHLRMFNIMVLRVLVLIGLPHLTWMLSSDCQSVSMYELHTLFLTHMGKV